MYSMDEVVINGSDAETGIRIDGPKSPGRFPIHNDHPPVNFHSKGPKEGKHEAKDSDDKARCTPCSRPCINTDCYRFHGSPVILEYVDTVCKTGEEGTASPKNDKGPPLTVFGCHLKTSAAGENVARLPIAGGGLLESKAKRETLFP